MDFSAGAGRFLEGRPLPTAQCPRLLAQQMTLVTLPSSEKATGPARWTGPLAARQTLRAISSSSSADAAGGVQDKQVLQPMVARWGGCSVKSATRAGAGEPPPLSPASHHRFVDSRQVVDSSAKRPSAGLCRRASRVFVGGGPRAWV